MSRQEVNIGVVGNDGTGDSIREAFRKVNDNFKEIYGVFNLGDAIGFKDLSDVDIQNPNTILSTIDTGSGIRIIDRILDGGTGISVVYDEEKISIRADAVSLDSDESPSLAGPLNAEGYPIANIGLINNNSVDTYNSIHSDNPITINDLVINKGYADQNYIRKTGGSSSLSGEIRVNDEPLDTLRYYLNIKQSSNNNLFIQSDPPELKGHGFDAAFDGGAYIYSYGGSPATNVQSVIDITNSTYFIIGRSYRIEELGSVDFTTLGANYNRVGEIFKLTSVTGILGYGNRIDYDGGSPNSTATSIEDNGTPSTATFSKIINGGPPLWPTGTSTGKVRPIYFLKFVNANELSIHPTYDDALTGNNKLNYNGGTGFQVFIDAYYDNKLEGNWLTSQVLPRKSVVRRQGDKMEGALFLHDHPFPLNGVGTPNRPDDLQAATKFYVDNSSFASNVNLYVSTTGNDFQTETPQGKEGRAWAYAFKSVGKACQVAEYMMNNAPQEPGPYRQLIALGNGTSFSIITEFIPPGSTGLGRLKFTNNNGGPVDQGVSPNIEIIAGKIIKGRLSGATGIVYDYQKDVSSPIGEDYVNLQYIRGEFIPGENLEFGDPVSSLHISVYVESGIYEEDYPIKVPANTAIIGDEFRRVLIRPRDRISESPWVYTHFFRNTTFDSMVITTGGTDFDPNLSGYYGYHYLKKPDKEINRGPNYINAGGYNAEAIAISEKKVEIQDAIVAAMETITTLSALEKSKSRRDTAFILDAIIHDLKEGGIKKIFDIQESFYNVTLTNECLLGLNEIDDYINTNVIPQSSTTIKTIITSMISKINFALTNPNYNTPKNNKDIDVFLMNDAGIIRQVTCQGHGGFMMVLDPEGQILSKSPYCQQSGSFAGSLNKKSFRGGQYIDGFNGNQRATVVSKISNTRLKVTDMYREPRMPTSFFISGSRYRVDTWLPDTTADTNARDLLVFNTEFLELQTTIHLNKTFPNTKYPQEEFRRHINNFIKGITFDLTLGGNSKTVSAIRRLFNPSTELLWYNSSIRPLLLSMLDYIKERACEIIVNLDVTSNQTQIPQIKIPNRSGTSTSQNTIVNLINLAKNSITNGIDVANIINLPTYVLAIDTGTPFLASNPGTITLITAGNTSMLSNDYTQVNDLGYGIITNNNGLSECVSVFSYYCWTGMFSNNGGQIRSLNSSSANGEYGLVASGSDPLELPDNVLLAEPTIQVARIYKSTTPLNKNLTGSGQLDDLYVYVHMQQFSPQNISIIEINHGPVIGVVSYVVNNIQFVETGIIKLNFNTSGSDGTSKTGLKAVVTHNQNVILRSGQNFKFKDVFERSPTRPSTALTFTGDPNSNNPVVYRVISYSIAGPDGSGPLASDEAILTFDVNIDFLILTVNQNFIATVDPENPNKTMGSKVSDIKIAVNTVSNLISRQRLNTGEMLLAWDGKIHRILGYTTQSDFGYITISDLDKNNNPLQNVNTIIRSGLNSTLIDPDRDITLRAGLDKDEPANITVNISTMRATGHDFLDIGTGGYNASNYPSKIYGTPGLASQNKEVQERSRGRVFYVSTDQDGFFRVGRFFTVDQGTGTVSFSASITLTSLDGIGFKKGTFVTEFSSDDRFTDLAEDAIPTEAAVSGYIDRRLGVDRLGSYLDSSETYAAVPGFLARNADVSQKGPLTDISWASHKLIDLADPTEDSDAATKNYVDLKVGSTSKLKLLKDTNATFSEPGNVLAFVNTNGDSASTKIVGDIKSTFDSTVKSALTAIITSTETIPEIDIVDASAFPNEGYVVINDEIFFYELRVSDANYQRLSGVIRLSISPNSTRKFLEGPKQAHAIGDIVYSLDFATIDLQIEDNTIVNDDIKSDAAIDQSKLNLSLATELASAPTGNAVQKQAASGLASFDNANFTVVDGWVKIKDGGVKRDEIEKIGTNKILGNLDRLTTQYAQEIAPDDFLKRATYDLLNPLSNIGQEHVLTFRPSTTEAASSFDVVNINSNVTANSIPKRTSSGSLKVTTIDSNGNVSIIAISGTTIITGVTYIGSGKFSCDPTVLFEGSRITVNGVNTGDLQLPSYSPPTQYFVINTNGNTEFTLSRTLNGQPITTSGTTISGLTFINATGINEAATPVIYKGQWSPGTNATLRASSADIWTNSRKITVTGDASGEVTFNGSQDVELALTLASALSALTAGKVEKKLKLNNIGTGATAGSEYDGSTDVDISYNSIGAPGINGEDATGTWAIDISGNAATATVATSVLNSRFSIFKRDASIVDVSLTVNGFTITKRDSTTVTIVFNV